MPAGCRQSDAVVDGIRIKLRDGTGTNRLLCVAMGDQLQVRRVADRERGGLGLLCWRLAGKLTGGESLSPGCRS